MFVLRGFNFLTVAQWVNAWSNTPLSQNRTTSEMSEKRAASMRFRMHLSHLIPDCCRSRNFLLWNNETRANVNGNHRKRRTLLYSIQHGVSSTLEVYLYSS